MLFEFQRKCYTFAKNDNIMTPSTSKEQTAFRFDKDLLSSMKMRAKSQNRSLNNYITSLVMEDLKSSGQLPKVTVPAELDPDIAAFSGILSAPDTSLLEEDERLAAIWNR